MENLKKNDCHVLLVSFPIQGHINPCLQFAKRLVNLGVQVTYCTSLTAFNRISNLPKIRGLSFASFSDGYDGSFEGSFDEHYIFYNSVKTYGSEFVINMVSEHAKKNSPFTRIIYTTLMSWVGLLAKSINVPSTLFWIQPATILDIYYYYFTGYADSFENCPQHQSLELPGLPLALNPRDFPSFVFTNVKHNDWAIQSIKEHIQLLNGENNPRVLVNTFDALEFDALRALKNIVTVVGVGPSIPSAFFEGKDPFDTSCETNLLPISKINYMDWLDEKPNESVVYIAFGSYAEISNQLMEEIAQGLIKSGRPFLWVVREGVNGEKPEEKLRCKEELEKQGKIVTWCSQVEVLHHPSVGCFLTHCGWNSTLESLVSGVPIVACPLWNDQLCNAKLIQDIWKNGVRVSANDEGIVEKDDLERCIDVVMKGEEHRKNAKKWRDLAKEAMKENGSSNLNLQAYVKEILLCHS